VCTQEAFEGHMTCHKCGRALAETRTTTKDPYHYTSSGLANLYLVGIVMRRCASCRTESPVIPRMGGLHRTIGASFWTSRRD